MRKDGNIGKLFRAMIEADKKDREFLFSCVIEEFSDGTYQAIVTEEDECGGPIGEVFQTNKIKSVEKLQNYVSSFDISRKLS